MDISNMEPTPRSQAIIDRILRRMNEAERAGAPGAVFDDGRGRIDDGQYGLDDTQPMQPIEEDGKWDYLGSLSGR